MLRHIRSARGAAALVALSLAAACDESHSPPPPFEPPDPTRDAGEPPPLDAGAPAADAAAPAADAGAPAAPDAGDACDPFALGEPTVRASFGVAADVPPALAARPDGALLAWVASVDGEPRLSVMRLRFDHPLPSVSGVTGETSTQRDPAIVATADGYAVAWRDARDGDFEILARAVDPAGVAAEALHVLSDNGVDDGPPGVGVSGRGDTLVAWVERGAAPRGRVAVLGPEGARSTYEIEALASAAAPPAIAPLADGGAALAWVDGASGAVRVQRLGAGGQPMGDAHTIAAEGQARGAVDLAPHGEGAVVTYEVRLGGARPELRYQVLDRTATPVGVERAVTRDVAAAGTLAPGAEGFLAAYRGRSEDDAAAALRLDRFEVGGEALVSTDVASARLDGTRVALRTPPDGSAFALAWVEDGRVLTASTLCEGGR